ncbi:glycoside hydrolase family 2 TIM barrel-domain containing protein [Aquabacter sp. CN5-332]|uniref:glycoside hydrolase family 2 TIM barrel-domain containing protein n=1 Tax=Aquabacter sp. CN5-332 TaxID=3156608 RepID=UPI0032B40BE1
MSSRQSPLAAALFLLALAWTGPLMASVVTVRGADILVDGVPFVADGAAGIDRLVELRGTGANVLRTYGEEPGEILDAAQRAGLKVIVGFWMEHPRRGFDYGNRNAVDGQLAQLRQMVERYRTHPALLAWGIGNEVETELTPAQAAPVWPAIEEAAKLVKSLDPAHPVMAVLADTGTDKVATLKRMAPSVDVLGLNAYGDSLLTVAARARAQGWTGPIIVTELGALGQWQAGKTPWGAAIELTSTEKADKLRRYLTTFAQAKVGALPFYWGQKQEVTPTWHSLFLPTGEWTEPVEAMAEIWGGKPPGGGNHAPRILAFRLNGPASFDRGTPAEATLAATDPDGDPLKVEWQIMAETSVRSVGGDAEPVPPSFSQGLRHPSDTGVGIFELEPGRYRLFVTVRDGRGAAATGNIPFEVR